LLNNPIKSKRITAPMTALMISATIPPTRTNPTRGKSQPARKAPIMPTTMLPMSPKPFEAALSKLELVDRKDPMTMTVAKLIIEFAKNGERDPKKLCDDALKLLGRVGSPLGEPSVEIKTQQERITRGRRSGPALHGLLNLLFYELLDSLHCLKATAVAFIK